MARILVLHYREARTGKQVIKALKAAGHQVWEAVPEHDAYASTLDVAKPDALVVESSHTFNRGLEAAGFITSKQAYRDLPVILVDLPEAGQAMAKLKVPEAHQIQADEAAEAVGSALAKADGTSS